LIEDLQIGDKIITIGGIYGEVESINDYEVVIRVEDGSLIRMLKTSIMGKQQMEEEVEIDDQKQ
jgi:preprotein translocase subunit YajC